MSSNAAEFATHVLDCLQKLPPSEPLSLAPATATSTGLQGRQKATSQPLESPTDTNPLPPIYGQPVSEEWIEAHEKLTQEVASLRDEVLLLYPDGVPSTTTTNHDDGTASAEADSLASDILSLRRGVKCLRQFSDLLTRITESTDCVSEVSEKLATLTTAPPQDDNQPVIEPPLKIIDEISRNLAAFQRSD